MEVFKQCMSRAGRRLCSSIRLIARSFRERLCLARVEYVRNLQGNAEMPMSGETEVFPVSRTRADLEEELITLIDSAKSRLLANIAINSGIRVFHLKDTVGAGIVVATVLMVLICVARILFALVFSGSGPPFPLASALAGFITAFSLGAVKILHDNILPPNAKNIASLPLDENGFAALRDWFQSFFSLPKQLAFSFSFGMLSVLTVSVIERNTSASFQVIDYVLAFLAIFSVGQGGYCGIFIPTLAQAATKERMRLFWLNPAESYGVRMASLAFGKLVVVDALFVSFCMIALYWFKPWESSLAALVSGAWLVTGWTAVSFAFLYPHYYLSRAIKAEKERQLANLQTTITQYQACLKEPSEGDFKKLSEFIALYDRLTKVRETSIDTQALRNFITSLVIPTMSFLGGLIDLGSFVDLRTLLSLPF